MVRLLLPIEAARRQRAGHRGSDQKADVRALRDAQDVDSLEGNAHADQETHEKAIEIGESVYHVADDADDDDVPSRAQTSGRSRRTIARCFVDWLPTSVPASQACGPLTRARISN